VAAFGGKAALPLLLFSTSTTKSPLVLVLYTGEKEDDLIGIYNLCLK
jgi:hypothetical protein